MTNRDNRTPDGATAARRWFSADEKIGIVLETPRVYACFTQSAATFLSVRRFVPIVHLRVEQKLPTHRCSDCACDIGALSCAKPMPNKFKL